MHETSSTEQEEAARNVIAAMTTAFVDTWSTHDAAALAASFTDDAWFINSIGQMETGWQR